MRITTSHPELTEAGLVHCDDGQLRPPWAIVNEELRTYYDTEWGAEVTDEAHLLERICLEGFQAGLSWQTILAKRPLMREVFKNFDPEALAQFSEDDINRIMSTEGMIRNQRKVAAVITNAQATVALRDDGGLSALVWSFKPKEHKQPETVDGIASKSPESAALAKELKKRGFKFVGPTTMYATMQAIGMVNDRVVGSAPLIQETESQPAKDTKPVKNEDEPAKDAGKPEKEPTDAAELQSPEVQSTENPQPTEDPQSPENNKAPEPQPTEDTGKPVKKEDKPAKDAGKKAKSKSSKKSSAKVAVVTGASSGIGKAAARALAADGWHVIVAARRMKKLKKLAKKIGGEAIRLDVTNDVSVAKFAAKVPQCHLLVNNAGGAKGLDPIAETNLDDWYWMYDTNVLGTVRVTKALLPKLTAANGLVVNISSIAGIRTYKGGAGYNAAKYGVHALSKVMRTEFVDTGLRVTEINPGRVKTDFSLVRFNGDKKRAAAVYKGHQNLVARDIAEAIRWVASVPAHVNVDQLVITPQEQVIW